MKARETAMEKAAGKIVVRTVKAVVDAIKGKDGVVVIQGDEVQLSDLRLRSAALALANRDPYGVLSVVIRRLEVGNPNDRMLARVIDDSLNLRLFANEVPAGE